MNFAQFDDLIYNQIVAWQEQYMWWIIGFIGLVIIILAIRWLIEDSKRFKKFCDKEEQKWEDEE